MIINVSDNGLITNIFPSISDYYNYSFDPTHSGLDPQFFIDSSKASVGNYYNYLMLKCNNSLSAETYQIEYQISALL